MYKRQPTGQHKNCLILVVYSGIHTTHKHTPILGYAGMRIVDAIDAAVVEHSGCMAFVDAVVGKVGGIGIHDAGHATGNAQPFRDEVHGGTVAAGP